MAEHARPLSPHLQVYKFALTMIMSILHRITGMGLYFGMGLLVAWLVALAAGGPAADFALWAGQSLPGQLVLFALTWTLFHHLLSGLRHFVWDLGKGFEPRARQALTWAALIGGLALTLIVWAIGIWS